MVFSRFGRKQPSTPEQTFWSWFVTSEPRLFGFETSQELVFDELGRRLRAVHADLTFEFGPVRDGRREFVISAGGNRSAFPAVEALHAAAPSLNRWMWVKFRQRSWPIYDIEYGGRRVKVDDVRYLLAKDGDRIGIVLFFGEDPEIDPSTFGQIGYLLLDEALGEHTVETQVGFIDRQSSASKYFAQSRPLRELPAHFDSLASPGAR